VIDANICVLYSNMLSRVIELLLFLSGSDVNETLGLRPRPVVFSPRRDQDLPHFYETKTFVFTSETRQCLDSVGSSSVELEDLKNMVELRRSQRYL